KAFESFAKPESTTVRALASALRKAPLNGLNRCRGGRNLVMVRADRCRDHPVKKLFKHNGVMIGYVDYANQVVRLLDCPCERLARYACGANEIVRIRECRTVTDVLHSIALSSHDQARQRA